MAFLNNTDIVVAIAFVIFIGILLYFKVPSMLGKMLDQRAERIRDELDEAKKLARRSPDRCSPPSSASRRTSRLRLARSSRRPSPKPKRQRNRPRSIWKRRSARRLQAAEDQIAAAEAAAVGEVRDRAVAVATKSSTAPSSRENLANWRFQRFDRCGDCRSGLQAPLTRKSHHRAYRKAGPERARFFVGYQRPTTSRTREPAPSKVQVVRDLTMGIGDMAQNRRAFDGVKSSEMASSAPMRASNLP